MPAKKILGLPRETKGTFHFGLYKILFHFEALLHNNIFANTPFIVQYIAQYYQLLHPPPNFEVFLRCL